MFASLLWKHQFNASPKLSIGDWRLKTMMYMKNIFIFFLLIFLTHHFQSIHNLQSIFIGPLFDIKARKGWIIEFLSRLQPGLRVFEQTDSSVLANKLFFYCKAKTHRNYYMRNAMNLGCRDRQNVNMHRTINRSFSWNDWWHDFEALEKWTILYLHSQFKYISTIWSWTINDIIDSFKLKLLRLNRDTFLLTQVILFSRNSKNSIIISDFQRIFVLQWSKYTFLVIISSSILQNFFFLQFIVINF